MPARLHLDANIVLRFLRNDHPVHSPAARRLFETAQAEGSLVVLSPVTVAEIFNVLTRVYKYSTPDACSKLLPLLQSSLVTMDNCDCVLDALARAANANVDFGDAYLAACAAAHGEMVASFDSDFRRFGDVKTIVPE